MAGPKWTARSPTSIEGNPDDGQWGIFEAVG
jgi:hypothetical protein